jgi:hypothetical protein
MSGNDTRLVVEADGDQMERAAGTLQFRGCYDRDRALLNSLRNKSEIVLDPKAYQEVMQVGLQMHREIDVPQGEVLLRTRIYDLHPGKTGTLGLGWLAKNRHVMVAVNS